MKKTALVALVMLTHAVFASSEKQVKSSIRKVTVFTQGAQVFRSSAVSLMPGTTQLVFTGISPKINPSSIQAGGKGEFVVLDVKHSVRYPEPPAPKTGLPPEIIKKIEVLEDSLSELSFRKEDVNERRSALLVEKNMMLNNKLAKGEGKSDSLAVLKQAMELFRTRLNDINAQLARLKREELANEQAYYRVNNRLAELRAYRDSEVPEIKYEPVHMISVTVSADVAAAGTVEISYMVNDAGWIPSYDLRSVTAAEPVQITYKANVYQNTGEDWNDVRLRLSTGNPNRSNVKPVLPTWYINYFTAVREMPVPGMARSQSSSNLSVINTDEAKVLSDKYEDLPAAQSAANYSQLIETMSNVEFDIKLAYDIPSDGVSHIVSVKTGELKASYVHYLVPKLDSEAFLLARVTGWESLNLLPGTANIFYEGTYVGQTVLNPGVINDTLDLSLGRDNGITVTRTRFPGKESSQLLGDNITKTVAYELRLKNNKSKDLKLIVEDQIPVSQSNEIKVALKDGGKADYSEKTGQLKWTFSLGAREYKSLKFSFEVTHDKDRPLSLN